jgi:hypothetical protein
MLGSRTKIGRIKEVYLELEWLRRLAAFRTFAAKIRPHSNSIGLFLIFGLALKENSLSSLDARVRHI